MAGDNLLQHAMDAMDRLCSDTNVSLARTLERLRELRDELAVRIEAVESDMARACRNEGERP